MPNASITRGLSLPSAANFCRVASANSYFSRRVSAIAGVRDGVDEVLGFRIPRSAARIRSSTAAS